MSAYKTYGAWCDAPDCGNEFDYTAPKLAELRRLMKAVGWVRDRDGRTAQMLDYCPEHKHLVGTTEARFTNLLVAAGGSLEENGAEQ